MQNFLKGLEPSGISCWAYIKVGTFHCSIIETTVPVRLPL